MAKRKDLLEVIESMTDKDRAELVEAIKATDMEKCGSDGYCHCQCGLHKVALS